MKNSYLLLIIILLNAGILYLLLTGDRLNPIHPNQVSQGGGEGLGNEMAVTEMPIDSLNPVQGLKLYFYAWEDGSAAVFEISRDSISFMANENLENASPAEIYWACSKEGKGIPPALVKHHEDIAKAEGRRSISEITSNNLQGWAIKMATHTDPCNNATFTANHCPPNTNYPDGGICRINTNGNWTWQVQPTRRYKAGFCLQSGRVNDYLYYWQP